MYPIRIKELRFVAAKDLASNPRNWRGHPSYQKNALRHMMKEIGIVDAVLAYQATDGSLLLIDGHLRKDLCAQQDIPVLILDIDPKEADKVLLTLDPLAALASTDHHKLKDLIVAACSESESFLSRLSAMPNMASYLDDRDAASVLGPLEYRIVIECRSEEQQIELLSEFDGRNIRCRPLIS